MSVSFSPLQIHLELSCLASSAAATGTRASFDARIFAARSSGAGRLFTPSRAIAFARFMEITPAAEAASDKPFSFSAADTARVAPPPPRASVTLALAHAALVARHAAARSDAARSDAGGQLVAAQERELRPAATAPRAGVVHAA